MFKKTAFAFTLFSLSLTATASEWQAGGGFGSLSDSSDGTDVSLNIIYGSLAYKIQKDNSNFFFVPELRLGTGIGDDSMNVFGRNVKVEVDSFLALSVRVHLASRRIVVPGGGAPEDAFRVVGWCKTHGEWDMVRGVVCVRGRVHAFL